MPIFKKIAVAGGILVLWQLTETTDALKSLLASAGYDPAGCGKQASPKRMRERLVVCLLLLEAGCQPRQLEYGEHGQPFILQSDYRHISISHSDRMAGLILNKNYPVGIDVESRKRNFIRVEHKYLSRDERQLARTIPDGHGLFWCIKEAVFKAAGIPGVLFAEHIRISLDPYGRPTVRLETAKNLRFTISYLIPDDQIVLYLLTEN